MHRYIAVLLAVVAAVNAQGLTDIPSCSLPCFTTALTTDGCASLTDFACHCAKPQLISQIQPCVAKACSQADQATINNVVQQTCQQAGVPINLPGSSSSSSAPASPSASATSPAPASSTAAASSTSPASSAAAAGCSTGCTMATSTSALASAMGSPSTTTTAASSGVAAATTGVTGANATSSITPYTGGAASSQVKGAFGSVVAVVAALAFAL